MLLLPLGHALPPPSAAYTSGEQYVKVGCQKEPAPTRTGPEYALLLPFGAAPRPLPKGAKRGSNRLPHKATPEHADTARAGSGLCVADAGAFGGACYGLQAYFVHISLMAAWAVMNLAVRASVKFLHILSNLEALLQPEEA